MAEQETKLLISQLSLQAMKQGQQSFSLFLYLSLSQQVSPAVYKTTE